METRANYTLVGAFAIFTLVACLLFGLWVAKFNRVDTLQYDIIIKDKVSGLSVNSDVLFNGIKVGTVTELKLSISDPRVVRARVAIAPDTPVRIDSKATLEDKGLTGVVLISIAGGTSSAALNIPPEDTVGTIEYVPSTISTVINNMPQVIDLANSSLQGLDKLLSDENIESVSKILSHTAAATGVLADKEESLRNIISSLETISKNMELFSEVLSLKGKDNTLLAAEIMKRINHLISQVEPGLIQFSKGGLLEVETAFAEFKRVLSVFAAIGKKIEDEPQHFIWGKSVEEYSLP